MDEPPFSSSPFSHLNSKIQPISLTTTWKYHNWKITITISLTNQLNQSQSAQPARGSFTTLHIYRHTLEVGMVEFQESEGAVAGTPRQTKRRPSSKWVVIAIPKPVHVLWQLSPLIMCLMVGIKLWISSVLFVCLLGWFPSSVLVANYTLKIHFRNYSIDRIARKIMEPDLTRYIKLIKFRRAS
jgi:hypothetical protein